MIQTQHTNSKIKTQGGNSKDLNYCVCEKPIRKGMIRILFWSEFLHMFNKIYVLKLKKQRNKIKTILCFLEFRWDSVLPYAQRILSFCWRTWVKYIITLFYFEETSTVKQSEPNTIFNFIWHLKFQPSKTTFENLPPERKLNFLFTSQKWEYKFAVFFGLVFGYLGNPFIKHTNAAQFKTNPSMLELENKSEGSITMDAPYIIFLIL